MAAAVLLTGLSTATAIRQTAGVEIRLSPAATVTDPQVRLGQIAAVTGDPATVTAVRSLAMTGDLKVSRKTTIRAWQVAEHLGEQGFDVRAISITGAAACTVDVVPANTPQAADGPTSLDLQAKQAGPASLETHVRQIICQNLSGKGIPADAQVMIRFNVAIREALALTDPPYRFDVVPQRTNSWLGLVGFRVTIYRDGGVLQTLPILADVQLRVPVLLASKVINSKARIGKLDVERRYREISSFNGKLLTNPGDVVGLQAKKMIHPGTQITADLVESAPMVHRGQLVNVTYRKGGLDIRIVGKALANAFKGEVIQVRNERSKDVFRARVCGEGEVIVVDTPAAGATGSAGETDMR